MHRGALYRRQARNTNHTLGDVAEAVTMSYLLLRGSSPAEPDTFEHP